MLTEKDLLAESLEINSIVKHSLNINLHIDRPAYDQEHINKNNYYELQESTVRQRIKKSFAKCSLTKIVKETIPVLEWLPKYSWQHDFLADILSGITVAIMHIPQGMAYGLLGNVEPVTGIYMAFFPVLIYFFLGTSRHISIGTFAIVCLMTGKTVSKFGHNEYLLNGTMVTVEQIPGGPTTYSNIQVAVTVTFAVAMIQLVMYIFRLGVITTLLSEMLVKGFTCACAFHVVSAQLKDLLGLPIKKRRGYFAILYTMYDAILALPQANKSAVSISLVAIVIMVVNNEIFKPWLSKKTKVPFPIELVAVVAGTAVSYILDLHNQRNISIVGSIPIGLPEPQMPVWQLLPDVFVDAIVICMISYTISMSMALIFAQKAQYEVNANQELLALSASNVFGSFFSCMPITASLSRSLIQYQVGGVTQLASIVSCFLLLILLLWVGPLFETLPRCILASIIVVALKGLLMQVTELPKFWKLKKWDGFVWAVSFVVTVLISIEVGLICGVLASLTSLFLRGFRPYTCLLGWVPNTELYLDLTRYKGIEELVDIKIFHFCGGLNFASKGTFKALLYRNVGFSPLSTKDKHKGHHAHQDSESEAMMMLPKCVIVDFSALSHIDPAGIEQLTIIFKELKDMEIEFLLAACSGPVYESFKEYNLFYNLKATFSMFPSIHDAVVYAQSNISKEKVV